MVGECSQNILQTESFNLLFIFFASPAFIVTWITTIASAAAWSAVPTIYKYIATVINWTNKGDFE